MHFLKVSYKCKLPTESALHSTGVSLHMMPRFNFELCISNI